MKKYFYSNTLVNDWKSEVKKQIEKVLLNLKNCLQQSTVKRWGPMSVKLSPCNPTYVITNSNHTHNECIKILSSCLFTVRI